MAKCVGSTTSECPDNKSGQGVKKRNDGKFRCNHCHEESPEVSEGNKRKPADEFVQNELLCFLATPWPHHNTNEVKDKCLDFFNDDQIAEAYRIITEYSDNLPSERSADDTEGLIDDTMRLLSTAKSGELPVFVAVNLHRLPSMTTPPPNDDSASTVKALEERFTKFARITRDEFEKVHYDIDRLHDRREMRPSPAKAAKARDPHQQEKHHHHQENQHQEKHFQEKHHHEKQQEEEEARSSPLTPPEKNPVNTPLNTPNNNSQHQPDTEITYAKMAGKIVGTVTNKKGLKVSPRPYQIYIGGLDIDTTPVNVMDYVLAHIGIQVPCTQLRTKSDTYTSFKISVDKSHLERVFNPTLWPSEAIIDYYRAPKYNRRRGYNRSENEMRNHRPINNDDKTVTDYYARKYSEQDYDEYHDKGYGYTGRNRQYSRQ